jgi:hypothetical protein
MQKQIRHKTTAENNITNPTQGLKYSLPTTTKKSSKTETRNSKQPNKTTQKTYSAANKFAEKTQKPAIQTSPKGQQKPYINNDLAASNRTNRTKISHPNIHQPISKEYLQAGSTRSKVQGSPHSLETFLSQQL